MQEAIKAFEEKRFHESKRLFIKSLETSIAQNDKIKIFEYIIKCNEFIGEKLFRDQEFIYLKLLKELERNQEIIIYIETKNDSSTNSLDYSLIYFEALFDSGELNKALEIAKRISLNIIEEKNYSHAKRIFELLSNKFPGYLFYLFGEIIFLIETGLYSESIEKIKYAIQKITLDWNSLNGKKKSKTSYLKQLIKLVEEFKVEDSEFRKQFLLLKCELKIKFNDIIISKSEYLEFVVLFSEERERLYLIHRIVSDEFIGYDVLDYLKSNNCVDKYNYKEKQVRVINKYSKTSQASDPSEEIDLSLNENLEQIDTDSIYESYGIKRLQLNESVNLENIDSPQKLIESIKSLINIGEYSSALELCEQLDNKELKIGLVATIFEVQRKYIDLITYLSECMYSQKENVFEETIMLNLARIYKKIGNESASENVMSLYYASKLSTEDLLKGLSK